MSMINRMLADLESRGAPKPKAGDAELVADRSRKSRRRPAWSRVFLVVLAVLLVILAVALWIGRGDRLLAGLPSVTGSNSADEVERAPSLVGLAFEGSAERPRLMLQIDGSLDGRPGYSRSGASATLVLAARTDHPMVPAPPPGQRVFRGLSLEPESQRSTRLRLAIAPDAELDLDVDGGRVTLTGRMPQVDVGQANVEAVSQPSGGDDNGTTGTKPAPETTAAGDETSGSDPEPGAPESLTSSQPPSQASAETEPPEPASDQRGSDTETQVEPEQTAVNSAGVVDDVASPVATETAGDNDHSTLRKSQSLDPEVRARRRHREGRQALQSGRLGEARRLLAGALELDPELHPARDLLVSLMRRAGEGNTARRLLDEGVGLAPERVEYAMPYARLLVDTGELDRAAGVLARARSTGANNAGFHALTAAVAQRRGRHEQAARVYTRALEIDANNGLWWLGLGISLAATERPGEARAAFREARASGDLGNSLDRWAAGRIEELGGEG